MSHPGKPQTPPHATYFLGDLRGGVRLVIDGVQGVTGIVESMHHRIARVSPPLGRVDDAPTRGVTGLVYRSIRGTTGLVGQGLDAALGALQSSLIAAPPDALPGDRASASTRDAVVSALNGVLGDHLERSGNPLAIPMQLVLRGPLASDGAPRADAPPPERGPRVLLLIHGLCMNDQLWTRDGHDHGQALAEAGGFTPVYARYNTGRHISTNGRELAQQLEALLAEWPVPVERLVIVGHSMGGLVARSAVHQARAAGMAWPGRLRQLVFLGSPHHGAPLERGGNWLHRALDISPYSAPFTRLAGLRSAGITDLRHGNLLDEDWQGDRFHPRDTRTALALPTGVACYAIAGSIGPGEGWLGDGIVPVASALGRHASPSHRLRIPASHQWVAKGVNHLDLLSSPAVAHQLRRWLLD